jgi:hypothetical protein
VNYRPGSNIITTSSVSHSELLIKYIKNITPDLDEDLFLSDVREHTGFEDAYFPVYVFYNPRVAYTRLDYGVDSFDVYSDSSSDSYVNIRDCVEYFHSI